MKMCDWVVVYENGAAKVVKGPTTANRILKEQGFGLQFLVLEELRLVFLGSLEWISKVLSELIDK